MSASNNTYTSGKIGSAIQFNGSNQITSTSTIGGGLTEFSFSCWVYPTTLDSSWRRIMGIGAHTRAHLDITSSNTLRFFVSLDGSTGNYVAAYSSSALSTNTWYHICGTIDNDYIKLYINGALIASPSISDKTISYTNADYFRIGGINSGNQFIGSMNDARFYDHCLSPKEVKEIAKGLVCHYTLAKNGGDNLITGYDTSFATIPNGTTTLFTNQMNGGAQEVVSNIGGAEKCLHLHSNGAQCRQYRTLGAQTGKIYTVSADYYSTTSQSPALRLELNGGNYSWFTINSVYDTPGEWRRVSCTTPSLTSDTTIYYFFYCNANQDCYIKNIKIEENTIPTPWTPNQSDSLYAKLGFNDAIEYDVSGYEHNGTKVGTINYEVDTPKYWTSTYFNGGDNAITVPFNTIISNSTIPFTINLWFKKTELGTDAYESLFGGPNGFEMDTRSGNSTTLSLYMASTRGGNVYSPFNLNEWYMVTMASDRTNEYYYVNGELVKTIEAKTMPVGDYFIGAWKVYSGQNIKGYISDFRIYATALSADDIKELYDTPISLASNGTLMVGGELTEA